MFVDAGEPETVIDCAVDQLHYGDFLAGGDTRIPIVKKQTSRRSSVFGLRQEHSAALSEPHERPGSRL